MREIYPLHHKWAFTKDADKPPLTMPKQWYWVNLPHTFNAIDGQDGGNDYYRGVCYYAKEIEKSELPEGECYYLELRGANSSAEVFANGKKLARHDGGYSTWRVDLTDALEEKNLLVIAVDNRDNDKVYPQVADFTFYGGLYRDVSILAVSASHFDLEYYGGSGIMVTPESRGASWDIGIEVFLTDAGENQSICYTVCDQDGAVVAEKKDCGHGDKSNAANSGGSSVAGQKESLFIHGEGCAF